MIRLFLYWYFWFYFSVSLRMNMYKIFYVNWTLITFNDYLILWLQITWVWYKNTFPAAGYISLRLIISGSWNLICTHQWFLFHSSLSYRNHIILLVLFFLTALFSTVSSVPNRQVSCYLIMLSIPSCIVLKQYVLGPLFNLLWITHHKLKYIIFKLLATLLYLWLCRRTNHFEIRKLTDLRVKNINNIILTLKLIVIITKYIWCLCRGQALKR